MNLILTLQLIAIGLSAIIIIGAFLTKSPSERLVARKLIKAHGSIVVGYIQRTDTSGYTTSGSIAGLPYTLDFRRDLDYAVLIVQLTTPSAVHVLYTSPESSLLAESRPVEKITAVLPIKTPLETGTFYSNAPAEPYLAAASELAPVNAWELKGDKLYVFVSAEKDIFPYSPANDDMSNRYDPAVQRFAAFVSAIQALSTSQK